MGADSWEAMVKQLNSAQPSPKVGDDPIIHNYGNL